MKNWELLEDEDFIDFVEKTMNTEEDLSNRIRIIKGVLELDGTVFERLVEKYYKTIEDEGKN